MYISSNGLVIIILMVINKLEVSISSGLLVVQSKYSTMHPIVLYLCVPLLLMRQPSHNLLIIICDNYVSSDTFEIKEICYQILFYFWRFFYSVIRSSMNLRPFGTPTHRRCSLYTAGIIFKNS